jgi:CRP/FNR family transcriptional regulator, cyclic AMP receptor protein
VKIPGLFINAPQVADVAAGSVVFAEGDPGEHMFGIVEGEVELRTGQVVIARLGPDDVFGEMAVIDASPRMATATATTDSRLAILDRHRFLFLVHETPMFALQVMSTMAERLRAHALHDRGTVI